MDDKIYHLLNHVKIDISKYDNISLSFKEKQRIKERFLKQNGIKKRKTNYKLASAACVIVILAGCTTTTARGLFSDTIERLLDLTQGSKYEAEDTEKYTQIGENSYDIRENTAGTDLTANQENITETSDQGITITASDIYCDGYQLYFSATLKGEEEILNGADWINPSTKNATSVCTINGNRIDLIQESFHKSSDDTYVMMAHMDLLSGMDLPLEEREPMVIDYKIKNLQGDLQDSWDENGDYVKAMDVSGDWHLSFQVYPDTTSNISFTIDKKENGVWIKDGIRTKSSVIINLELSDLDKTTDKNTYNPEIRICDENGKSLQWLGNHTEERSDGSSAVTIMILYNGEQGLHLEVRNKGHVGKTIADIPFQVS